MRKLFIFTLLISSLNAQDFESFLQESLKKSPLLRTNALTLKQASESANVTTRYKNPTLSLEASSFSPDVGKDKLGYRVALSQPIRLWGIAETREELANRQKEETYAGVKLMRANFIAELSSLYAMYKRAVFEESLAKKELQIAQNIANISMVRFNNGTIAKVKSLQASLDIKRVKNFLAQKSLERYSAYYRLMGFRGLNEEVAIDTNYSFTLSRSNTIQNNATILLGKAQTKIASAKAKLNANKLEWIDLYGEFEQEPDQTIARVGIDIPLVIFNTKKEEKTIATLEAKKRDLLVQNRSKTLIFKLKEYSHNIQTLQEIEATSEALLISQERLLKMYEEGYKIASIHLIELQTIKNQLIETKENLLKITLEKELTIIKYNYLTGTYNE